MSLSLRDYSTPELEALLERVKAAIDEAEKAERQKAKRQARLAASPPPEPASAAADVASPIESGPSAAAPAEAAQPSASLPASATEPPAPAPARRTKVRSRKAGEPGQAAAPAAEPLPAEPLPAETLLPQTPARDSHRGGTGAAKAKRRLQHEPVTAPEAPPPVESPAAPLEAAAEAPREGPEAGERAAPPPPAPAIKYMHPSNRKMTWSGEGEQPEWMKIYLALGGTWTALENTARRFAGGRGG